MQRPPFLFWLQATALFVGFELTGFLSVQFQADSDSYLYASKLSFLELLADKRTFPYPLFLKYLPFISPGLSILPEIQFLVHVLAVFVFYRGLRAYGFQETTALIGASPLLYTRVFWVHVQQVMTDSMAASLAILTVGLLLIVIGRKRTALLWLGLGISLFMTYLLRPAYLFLVPLLPFLGWALSAIRRRAFLLRKPRTLLYALLVLSFGPLLFFSAVRFMVVGHFGLASVGGLNIVSLATQMLTDDLVKSLPANTRELALAIIHQRKQDRETMENKKCAEPLKVRHTRYVSYEVFAECYNYHGIMSEQVANTLYRTDNSATSLVLVNRKLTELSFAILKVRPMHYAFWVFYSYIYGMAAVVRYDYPVVLLGFLLGAIHFLIALRVHYATGATLDRAFSSGSPSLPLEFASMTLLATTFFFSGLLLIVLVEPAMSRYVYGVAVFVPSILALATYAAYQNLRRLLESTTAAT